MFLGYVVYDKKYILRLEEKDCGRSTTDIPTPSSLGDQEITRTEGPKIIWYEWLKEPLLYKVSASLKVKVKLRTTKPCNLCCDIAGKRVKYTEIQRCCAFYHSRIPVTANQVARFRKVVAERREWFYFSVQQNLCMLRVLPAQGKLVLQQVT